MSALAGPSTVVSSGRRMLLASSLCKCLLQRPTSAAVATFARSRAIHTRPTLPYDINAGVEPFLSARALRGTAVEWHQGNLDRLNDLVRGTQYENMDVAQTVISSAKRPTDALIFGYASEVLNNGFFLSCLTPTPGEGSPRESLGVSEIIADTFGSITSFINHFSSYASGQFGSGYVWLVLDASDNLAVLSTYGSGTVLVQGNANRAPGLEKFEPEAEGTQLPGESASSSSPPQPSISSSNLRQQIRRYATMKPAAERDPISFSNVASTMGKTRNSAMTRGARRSDDQRFVSIFPLLALSLHAHVYIPDYGINGKIPYIERFWNNVDWERMDDRYRTVRQTLGGNKINRSPMSSRPQSDALSPSFSG